MVFRRLKGGFRSKHERSWALIPLQPRTEAQGRCAHVPSWGGGVSSQTWDGSEKCEVLARVGFSVKTEHSTRNLPRDASYLHALGPCKRYQSPAFIHSASWSGFHAFYVTVSHKNSSVEKHNLSLLSFGSFLYLRGLCLG